jgi:hypothetical protein
MESQYLISYAIFFKLCNLNFSTCYKVCSLNGITIVLTSRRNLLFRRITWIVINLVIEFNAYCTRVSELALISLVPRAFSMALTSSCDHRLLLMPWCHTDQRKFYSVEWVSGIILSVISGIVTQQEQRKRAQFP